MITYRRLGNIFRQVKQMRMWHICLTFCEFLSFTFRTKFKSSLFGEALTTNSTLGHRCKLLVALHSTQVGIRISYNRAANQKGIRLGWEHARRERWYELLGTVHGCIHNSGVRCSNGWKYSTPTCKSTQKPRVRERESLLSKLYDELVKLELSETSIYLNKKKYFKCN